MRLSAISAFSGAVSLILGLTVPALAGTPPPCIKAASSKPPPPLGGGCMSQELLQGPR